MHNETGTKKGWRRVVLLLQVLLSEVQIHGGKENEIESLKESRKLDTKNGPGSRLSTPE